MRSSKICLPISILLDYLLFMFSRVPYCTSKGNKITVYEPTIMLLELRVE